MNTLTQVWIVIFLLVFQCLTAQEYIVERLSTKVNTEDYDEISPVVSLDGKTMFFTRVAYPTFERTIKLGGIDLATTLNSMDYDKELSKIYTKIAGETVTQPATSPFNQDIWIAESTNGKFESIYHPSYPLNNALPNSVSAITPNGNEVVVINRFAEEGGMEKGFSISRKKYDGTWSFPESINIENYYNTSSDVNLAMSSNGEVIILSMERPDSFGDNDLYICFRIGVNHWSEPMNLGPKVNTAYRETTPFISDDGTRIFFSSDRKGTEGGSDIFFIDRENGGWKDWSSPYRFVYPINSKFDDSQPYFNAATGFLYFTSNRYFTNDKTEGSIDIFRAQIAPPNPINVVVKGRLINSKTKKMIPGNVLFGEEGKPESQSLYISDDGTYKMAVPKGKTIELKGERTGFTAKPEMVSFKKDYVYYKEYQIDLYLTPLEAEAKIEVPPVFFEKSRAKLLDESYATIDQLADFLKDNWNVSIRIEGHTDNQGKEKALLDLSKERAQAIKRYLVYEKFIQPLRIDVVGYGGSKPLNGNENELQRAENRRVEFIITKINHKGTMQTKQQEK